MNPLLVVKGIRLYALGETAKTEVLWQEMFHDEYPCLLKGRYRAFLHRQCYVSIWTKHSWAGLQTNKQTNKQINKQRLYVFRHRWKNIYIIIALQIKKIFFYIVLSFMHHFVGFRRYNNNMGGFTNKLLRWDVRNIADCWICCNFKVSSIQMQGNYHFAHERFLVGCT